MGVFLNLLLSQKGIRNTLIEGEVVETKEKQFNHPNPQMIPYLHSSALNLEPDAVTEMHVWNLVYTEEHPLLVDCAFRIQKMPVVLKLEQEPDLRSDVVLELPEGRFRHYRSIGALSVLDHKNP